MGRACDATIMPNEGRKASRTHHCIASASDARRTPARWDQRADLIATASRRYRSERCARPYTVRPDFASELAGRESAAEALRL